MPEFSCRIATPAGEIVERSYTANDEASLRHELEGKDYLVLDLRRHSALASQVATMFRVRPRVSPKEFLLFNQELSALLKAGLPVLQSLNVLLERRKNPVFRRALADIRERVRSGESLSEAFAAQGDLFPKLYAATLASGERTGELPTVLRRYIEYSRNLLAVRRKVAAALVYPAVLVTLMIGLVLLMVFYIIPRFKTFLTDFGTDLPFITVALLTVTDFCVAHWVELLVGAVVGVASLVTWRRSEAGRRALDRIQLRLPVLGGIARDYAQNRFTRTLATLQAGGIPLVTSLEIAARAVGNSVFEERLFRVASRVREGQALWESLEETGLMSDIAVEMVKVGESTGALVEMLNDVSDFVDQEIDQRLQRAVSLIEPAMLVFMAFVVAGMLLAIYYPMLQAYGSSRF